MDKAQDTTDTAKPADIIEAAAVLGITEDAVRKRIARGKLQGFKKDNRWFVILDKQDKTGPDTRETGQGEVSSSPNAKNLREELLMSRAELAAAHTEAATARGEAHRMEAERELLVKQLERRDVELAQALQLANSLQQRLALPDPNEAEKRQRWEEERDRRLVDALKSVVESRRRRWPWQR